MERISFERLEERRGRINAFLAEHGIGSLDAAAGLCLAHGLDVPALIWGIQPIAFDDACWAYTVGAAAVLTQDSRDARENALLLGRGLQSFAIPGSVAEKRDLGVQHGRLAARLLDEETRCFAFLAGHESFAAAEGAIGVAASANKARKAPLRVILVGLGKDAAEIIARFNGFTYIHTEYDLGADRLTVAGERRYSPGDRGEIRCYGAKEMREGVAIMELEEVDVSISGNATNMVKFQHPVAGTYKKRRTAQGRAYFACASGGGIGRTLNPDDIAAGPASNGYTDMLSLMYADAIFAGSSSVPAHVEMMGFVGMGNNPMVGATVSLAVQLSECAGAEGRKPICR